MFVNCIKIVVVLCLVYAFKPADQPWKTIDATVAAKELKDMQQLQVKYTKYSVNLKYFTYDTKNDEGIKDKSEGYIIKYNNCIKSRLMGIYTLQNKSLRISIDSVKKLIQVSNPFTSEQSDFSLNDYIKILGYCKAVKKATVNKTTGYRFETKNIEGVMAQEVFLEEGIIKEANIYYANKHFVRENNTVRTEMVYPKLQVLFSNFNSNLKLTESDFNEAQILVVQNNKTIKLTEAYRGFKLIDGRVKK